MNFTNFCEAQLVWDKAMAVHALGYVKKNPDRIMVLLAGTGHAWKKGIPERIKEQLFAHLCSPPTRDTGEP